MFANGGHELGLRQDTLALLAAPAVAGGHGFHDECLGADAQFSLGFMKSNPNGSFGSPQADGSPGAGGSLGYADPTSGIGDAYVTNRKSIHIEGDPRERPDAVLRGAVKHRAKFASACSTGIRAPTCCSHRRVRVDGSAPAASAGAWPGACPPAAA